MKFSIIIQSYLGHYEGAATNRDKKIIRAIDSALNQTYKDFEIIVVADGCEQTFNIIEKNYAENKKVECYLITKRPIWSGQARNFGITKAKGEYIVYLDIDDCYGENHLQLIIYQLKENDWVWFDDYVMGKDKKLTERKCMIKEKFQSNTSNLCHKKSLNVLWYGAGYGLDDHALVKQLLTFSNHEKIKTPEYLVHHIPKKLDV